MDLIMVVEDRRRSKTTAHTRGDILGQGAAERLGTQVFGTLLRPDQDPVEEVATT